MCSRTFASLIAVFAIAEYFTSATMDSNNEFLASKFVLLDLPENMDTSRAQYLVIRSNYKGSVVFVPSDKMKIEVNVTAPSVQDLSKVWFNFTEYQGSLLFHLFHVDPPPDSLLIYYVGLFIAAISFVSFLSSIIYVCWWRMCRKPDEDDKTPCPDSSQAPLLDGHIPSHSGQSSSQSQNKAKKRIIKNPQHQVQTDESCVSSEDDLNETLPKKTPAPPKPLHRRDKFEMESLQETFSSLPVPLSTPMSDSSVQSVSCILVEGMDPPSCSKKGGQYIRLAASEKRYEVDDKGGSLRQRRDTSGHGDIPDVVRTKGGTLRGNMSSLIEGCSQYVTLTGPDVDPPVDAVDFRSLRKCVNPGKQGDSITKHERPTVTFAPTSPKKTDNFDSFGRPRTAAEDVRYATIASGARSKDPSFARRTKQQQQGPTILNEGVGGTGFGHHFSPSSSSTDRSSDSGRMTDEAYGTLGSTVSNSTTSTGSDSSGSVVTVIAADVDVASRRAGSGRSQGGMKTVMSGLGKEHSGTLPVQKREDRPTVRFSNQPSTTPKYLNTSILFTLTFVLLFGCSCFALHFVVGTQVHLVVHVPHGFLKYRPEVFVKKEHQVKVTNEFKADALQVDVYDVEDASLATSHDKCEKTSCAQSCDPLTGGCICKRGYRLVDGHKCEDVNECLMLEPVCHKNANCKNLEGKFSCECSKGFFGDGFNCQACNVPCSNGTFEASPCSETHPKVCKECTGQCSEKYFISAICTPAHDTLCTKCRDNCSHTEYEYTPCAGPQNRRCKDISSLPKPVVSGNILYEDLKEVRQVVSHNTQHVAEGHMEQVFPLRRSSGFTVKVTFIETNMAPLFRAVDHSSSNDNEALRDDMKAFLEHCPYPVPQKYNLTLILHEGVTSKAQYHTCDLEGESKKKKKRKKRSTSATSDDVETCEGDIGYFLNPKEPCKTYMTSGRLPDLNSRDSSVLCVKSARMTDQFGVSNKFDEVSTSFLDVNSTCASRRTKCDECLKNCARKMQSYVGSHRCNITADDADNGESPRLQYCYSCCNKQDCSKDCEVYYDRDCPQMRCITGNMAEFVLNPIFASEDPTFTCHIEPVPNYTIYDISYEVLHFKEGVGEKVVNDRVLKAVRKYSQSEGHPYKAEAVHNFLTIEFGSEISSRPDLIQRNIQSKTFKAGFYQSKGQNLGEGTISMKTLFVRPKHPFGISKKTWKQKSCDSEVMSELTSASGLSHLESFKTEPQLDVFQLQDGMYRLYNKTPSAQPFILLRIPKEQSILSAVYDPTTVKDDQSLKADLIRKEKEWNLFIAGELLKCPGWLHITVRDPLHPLVSLFNLDVGVSCPSTFNFLFTIPTEGPDVFNKTFLVDIQDTHRTIKITVFRPAPILSEKDIEFFQSNGSLRTPAKYALNQESPILILTPPIAVLCVIVVCLVVILFIGVLTESDQMDTSKLNSEKIEPQHYFFVVCYVTFKTTYSVVMTFAVLVVLIKHFNKESVATLTQFPQFVETASHSQKLDIYAIHGYVKSEIQRQNNVANQTKHLCELKLVDLQNQLEDAKQSMKVHTYDDKQVSRLALEYTKLMVLNLTRSINKFKQEFTLYANKALEKLKRSIVQTSSAIESSKWMEGPKIIYETVKAKRSALGLDTKPFLQWAGIKQEVDRLVADLSLKDFPLPNLTEFLNIEVPKTNSKPIDIPKASDVILPKNQWYYQYEKKQAPVDQEGTEDSRHSKTKSNKGRPNEMISFGTFLVILVVIDSVWFVHRAARTYYTSKMILHGCPLFISCKVFQPEEEMSEQRQEATKPSKLCSCLYFIRDLNFKIMRTDFVPKMVASVTVGCVLYIGLAASDKLVTVKTLASIGYFDALVAPLETSYRLAITRVKMNAHRINKFELPFFEELVNVRSKRYQLLLEMYAEVQRSSVMLRDSEYCMWKKLLKPEEPCNCSTVEVTRLNFDGCELPPVTPLPYHKRDFGSHREQLSHTILPYIDAARDIVMDTGHLVALFVAILALVDALGNVIWIYFKRFNLLRLKPLFEIEHIPVVEENQRS